VQLATLARINRERKVSLGDLLTSPSSSRATDVLGELEQLDGSIQSDVPSVRVAGAIANNMLRLMQRKLPHHLSQSEELGLTARHRSAVP
jgi:hypothetical protein